MTRWQGQVGLSNASGNRHRLKNAASDPRINVSRARLLIFLRGNSLSSLGSSKKKKIIPSYIFKNQSGTTLFPLFFLICQFLNLSLGRILGFTDEVI